MDEQTQIVLGPVLDAQHRTAPSPETLFPSCHGRRCHDGVQPKGQVNAHHQGSSTQKTRVQTQRLASDIQNAQLGRLAQLHVAVTALLAAFTSMLVPMPTSLRQPTNPQPSEYLADTYITVQK
jgi:hypothetical protein